MRRRKITMAFKAINLVDEVIEKLILYLTRDKEPVRAAFLRTMIADLKQVKRLIHTLNSKGVINRTTCLELCNQLFVKMLRRLKGIHKRLPFSIYQKTGLYESWSHNQIISC